MQTLVESEPCRGRESDIERVCSRIYSEAPSRSATLICGDSGIGKTKLLAALRIRLNEPSVFCGYTSAHPGDRNDPLARSLDNLLKHHVYPLSNWSARVRAAVESTRSALKDVDKLNSFCASVASAAVQTPLLSGIAAPITSALGGGALGAARKIADLFGMRTKLQVFVADMSSEVVEDILAILSRAFPETRFVLLLDNISADTESLGGTGRIRNLDSLVAFLAEGLPRLSNVHLVATWKLNPQSMDVLKRLSSSFREHGGEVDRMRPLDSDAIAEWLYAEQGWFRQFDARQRDEAVHLANGLPQVVASWAERTREGVSMEELRLIARDASRRKFSWLRDEALREDQPALLYQLTILPWLPPARSLADLTGKTESELQKWLGRWRDNGLLSGAGDEIHFSHESKRDVIRAALEEDEGMPESARQTAARQLLSALIENADFPSQLHPRSFDYLDAAAEIVGHAGVPEWQREGTLKTVNALRTAVDPSDAEDLQAMLASPAGLQLLCYARAAAAGTERWLECGLLADRSTQYLGTLDKKPELKLWRMQSFVLWHARHKNNEACFQVLTEMRDVLAAAGRPHLGEEAFARALANGAAVRGNAGDIAGLESILDELREARRRNGYCHVIGPSFAHALLCRLIAYKARNRALSTDEVDRTLSELRGAIGGPRQDETDVEILSRALCYAWGESVPASKLFVECKQLLACWPANQQITADFLWLAHVNVDEALHRGAPAADLLRELADGPESEQAPIYTQRAMMIALAAEEARRCDRFEEADIAVGHAYALFAKFPDVTVAIHVAAALAFGIKRESPSRGRVFILHRREQTAALSGQFPASTEIGERWAAICIRAITDLLEEKRADDEWCDALDSDLEKLREVRLQFPDSLEIATKSSDAHDRAALNLLRRHRIDFRSLPAVVAELASVCERWPDQLSFAKGAIAGWWLAAVAACLRLRDAGNAMKCLVQAESSAKPHCASPEVIRSLAQAVKSTVLAADGANLPELRERCMKHQSLGPLLTGTMV